MSADFSMFWIFCLVAVCSGKKFTVNEEEKYSSYWEQDGQSTLHDSLRMLRNEGLAKRVILFLGDGMGMTTVTAMRIYKGQKKSEGGENEKLTFDKFPHVSLSKTYGVDRQTSDSANTATAYMCGVKANYGTLGVDGRVKFEDCESSLDKDTHVTSILKWAQEKGMGTGIVTSTRVTHATPAGSYAHSASRNWESATPDPRCTDIAHQLVHEEPGKNIKVVMGGGRRHFIPVSAVDEDGTPGSRNDSRNLLEEWAEEKKKAGLRGRLIFNAQELKTLRWEEVDHVMGLFYSDHLPYVSDRSEYNKEFPTLPQMVEMAINILDKDDKGFVLLVEGGKIDLAHHLNFGQKALEEGVEFDQAVQLARTLTDEKDTLIVVTADHSHTFTVGGDYPLRGSSIVGLGGVSDVDNKTFTTLGYHNGPGYRANARERNLTQDEVVQKDYHQEALFPMQWETHGAEDVPVYAIGPMSHLYHGVHEQSYIPYVMGYAACIGPNTEKCSGAWSVLDAQRSVLQLSVALMVYYLSESRTFQ